MTRCPHCGELTERTHECPTCFEVGCSNEDCIMLAGEGCECVACEDGSPCGVEED